MDDRDVRPDYSENDNHDKEKKGLGWLWLLIPLILLPLIAYFLLVNGQDEVQQTNSSDSSNSSANQENNSNASASMEELASEFNSQFAFVARSVYFTPDSTEFENEAESTQKLDAIAEFAKKNPSVKLLANGSIFADGTIDSASQLAKQRAEMVKSLLVEKGVKAENVSVSTVDKYEGQDDADRGMYARSVSVSVDR